MPFVIKKNESSLFFVFLNTKSLSNLFASLRYCQFLKSTNSLRFAYLIFGNNYARFASLDSQVNVNFLRFASIFKFLNINMFASLQNKFQTNEHFRFATILKFFNINMFASLPNNFFIIEHVRFASLDSQFNINLLCFASIFKFASLRNKLSNYGMSSLRLKTSLSKLSIASLRFDSHAMGHLQYQSSRSDFGFEFSETFVIEKRLPASVSRGVDKIA